MKKMTETVLIMPRQPIEARASGPHSFAADRRGVKSYVAVDDEARVGECILPADHWVEVSDPIEWDDEDPIVACRIAELLPAPYELLCDDLDAQIVTYDDGPGVIVCAIIPNGGRIQIVGDSFVILPPEMES